MAAVSRRDLMARALATAGAGAAGLAGTAVLAACGAAGGQPSALEQAGRAAGLDPHV
jgi:hypothetical protein